MARVLIEFFDTDNLNNCISQLHADYERVIYFYFPEMRTPETEILFKSLIQFNKRIVGVEPEFICVDAAGTERLGEIYDRMISILNDTDTFEMDITGGPREFTATAGMVLNSEYGLGENDVSIHAYDLLSGECRLIYPPAEVAPQKYSLSVREIISLRGAAILPGIKYKHDLSRGGLENAVMELWKIVKEDVSEWNSFCGLSQRNEKRMGIYYVAKELKENTESRFSGLIEKLRKSGIIGAPLKVYYDGKPCIEFSLNVAEDAAFLYQKGGTVLEMLVYLAAVRSGAYSDCCVNIIADWDGVIENFGAETKNEFDVVLSNGRLPFLISCKSTEDVTKEHLYELQTVADHYGGTYSVKVLACSKKVNDAVRERADNMGIIVLDDIHNCSFDTLVKKIRNLTADLKPVIS